MYAKSVAANGPIWRTFAPPVASFPASLRTVDGAACQDLPCLVVAIRPPAVLTGVGRVAPSPAADMGVGEPAVARSTTSDGSAMADLAARLI